MFNMWVHILISCILCPVSFRGHSALDAVETGTLTCEVGGNKKIEYNIPVPYNSALSLDKNIFYVSPKIIIIFSPINFFHNAKKQKTKTKQQKPPGNIGFK